MKGFKSQKDKEKNDKQGGKGKEKVPRSLRLPLSAEWESQNIVHSIIRFSQQPYRGCAQVHSQENRGVVHKPGKGINKIGTQGYIIGHFF